MAELNTTVTVGLTDELREAIAQAKRDRRERIATAVLAAIVSRPNYVDETADYNIGPVPPFHKREMESCADLACDYADALIAALDAEADRG